MTGNVNNRLNAALENNARRLRLLNYQRPESQPLERPIWHPPEEQGGAADTHIEALEHQKQRLTAGGGFAQQERMIYDKRKAFDRALLYSYQGANVEKAHNDLSDDFDIKQVRALINADKLKQDYDDKIISIPYECEYHTGDVFHWVGTDTYWLIYLQDLTELSYFRGSIRRCSYEINWEDEDNVRHHTYVAVRGPVETKINYIQKHGISVDTPNYSLNILIPKTPDSEAYFKRYAKFYMKDNDTCWRVEAVNSISMPDIIELSAVEYYANEFEDSDFVVGALIKEPQDPNSILENAAINGSTFIKPKANYTYTSTVRNGEWSIDPKYPVKLTVDKENPRKCTIQWLRAISGQFELSFGDYTKTIVVESLF